VKLFTPARHAALHCDAFLIDTSRKVRPLVLDVIMPLDGVIDAILDRVVLMSRSLHAVRHKTFGLFCARREDQFVLGPAYPFYASVFGDLRETLEGFGRVRVEPDEDLRDGELWPLIAYVNGQVSFFDSAETRAWVKHASRRGMRIVVPALSHAPDEDVCVEGVPAREYMQAPAEDTLDPDITEELPAEALERLLREQREPPSDA
jgi:hypothetical protein